MLWSQKTFLLNGRHTKNPTSFLLLKLRCKRPENVKLGQSNSLDDLTLHPVGQRSIGMTKLTYLTGDS